MLQNNSKNLIVVVLVVSGLLVGSVYAINKGNSQNTKPDDREVRDAKINKDNHVVKEVSAEEKYMWPVDLSRVVKTQGFGGTTKHDGIDLADKELMKKDFKSEFESTIPVMAFAKGTVVEVGYGAAIAQKVKNKDFAAGQGRAVLIKHNDNLYSLYSHLSDVQIEEKNKLGVGSEVMLGDVIGTMGNTGNSTGTHLHFALCKGYCFDENVELIDPEKFLGNAGLKLE